MAPAAPVFLLQRALVEVMRTGTARSARARLPVASSLAGKTGTTDGLRDSWFAGYGNDRLGVVWIGRDDNGRAGLTGAGGALRVWTDIMAAIGVRPVAEQAPQGVEWYGVDLMAGLRFNTSCDVQPELPFLSGSGEPILDCVTGDVSARVAGRMSTVIQQHTEDGQ